MSRLDNHLAVNGTVMGTPPLLGFRFKGDRQSRVSLRSTLGFGEFVLRHLGMLPLQSVNSFPSCLLIFSYVRPMGR